MRTFVKALLILGFGIAQMPAAPPQALAADAALTPGGKSVRVIHHRSRVVRDYDGTPIVLRVAPAHLQRGDGSVLEIAIPAPRAVPRTYLNGEPVLPTTAVLRKYGVIAVAVD